MAAEPIRSMFGAAEDQSLPAIILQKLNDKLPPLNAGEFVANGKDWMFLLNRPMFTPPRPEWFGFPAASS